MDRGSIERWVADYERAWRTAGTEPLAELFTEGAVYSTGPFETPFQGRAAIERMWEAEREGHDEVFSMTSDVVAVEGQVGVVRLEVDYGNLGRPTYRDLWVIELDADGRCRSFEEWPFWPEGAEGTVAGKK
jgi:ketosteroid isomerase-like protein